MPPLHLLLHSCVATFRETFRPAVSRGRCNSKAALGNDKPLKGWLSMSRPGAIPFTSSHRRQRHRSDLAASGRHRAPPPVPVTPVCVRVRSRNFEYEATEPWRRRRHANTNRIALFAELGKGARRAPRTYGIGEAARDPERVWGDAARGNSTDVSGEAPGLLPGLVTKGPVHVSIISVADSCVIGGTRWAAPWREDRHPDGCFQRASIIGMHVFSCMTVRSSTSLPPSLTRCVGDR
jgi:hypothetical protein